MRLDGLRIARWIRQTRMRNSARFFLLASLLILPFSTPAQNAPSDTSPIAQLHWFTGHWACEGKFASGKSISANLNFETSLDDHWILFRHDDNPPFSYHALSEWGWDQKSQQFVSLIQDSAGGARVFYSSGWKDGKFLWEGGSLSANFTHSERFEFTKIDVDTFLVSYSYLKSGNWMAVDTSRCTRVKVPPLT